jgi:outer membrane protein assembly factor BamB
VGSVPVSGRLSGDISLWDPVTGAVTVDQDPVPGQTPVSLVAHDGLLWGGTSIDGGYGIKPTATSGELFAFDPVTGKVVFQLLPKQGAVNVSGLALDGSGNLWGLADSTLFEFNLSTRRIVREEALAAVVDGSMYGIEHKIVFDAGQLYATTDEKLFQVDTVSWKARAVYDGPASDLTQDRYGRLYFVQEPSYVYRYDLPAKASRRRS